MTDYIVRASNLVKSYRRGPEVVHALRGVDFTIGAAEVVGLIGPSGSGKTTLLNLVVGWEQPDEGRVTWGKEDGLSPDDRMWSDLSIVPQRLGLIEELTVEENVDLPLRLGDLERDGRGTALLERLGLAGFGDRLPAECSLGEQQRTALARALVGRPSLLLADEPTGHQDAAWATEVFRTLRAACAEGTSCLVATHNQEVLKFVDRILTIHDGRIVEDRPVAAAGGD